jgi:hypothetical protein
LLPSVKTLHFSQKAAKKAKGRRSSKLWLRSVRQKPQILIETHIQIPFAFFAFFAPFCENSSLLAEGSKGSKGMKILQANDGVPLVRNHRFSLKPISKSPSLPLVPSVETLHFSQKAAKEAKG